MPRRPGYGPATGVAGAADGGLSGPARTAEDGKRVRAQLSSFISSGILRESICPDWDRKGSTFQLLEWLGDSVVNMFMTQQVFFLFSGAGATEGQMSIVRNTCAGTLVLAKAFKSLDLARLLRHPGGPDKMPNYLVEEKKCADVVEAILGELFEEAKKQAEASSVPTVAGSVGSGSASEMLQVFMDYIFRLGIEDCPHRLRPTAPPKLWLLGLSPAAPEGAAAGAGAAEGAPPGAAPPGGAAPASEPARSAPSPGRGAEAGSGVAADAAGGRGGSGGSGAGVGAAGGGAAPEAASEAAVEAGGGDGTGSGGADGARGGAAAEGSGGGAGAAAGGDDRPRAESETAADAARTPAPNVEGGGEGGGEGPAHVGAQVRPAGGGGAEAGPVGS